MTVENDRDNHIPTGGAQTASIARPSLSSQRRLALTGWSIMMLVIAALSLWPEGIVSDHHHLDKIGHFLAYSVLAFLPSLFASSLRQAAAIMIAMCLIGVGLEGGQAFLPDRVPSLLDTAANLVGAVCGTGAGFIARPFLKQIVRDFSA
jgi:VanZ family protein